MTVDVDAAGKLTIETPEQVGIELEVAGLGSRFLAALVDLLCMLVFLIAAMAIAIGAMGGGQPLKQIGRNAANSDPWTKGLGATAAIVLLLSVFLVQWGYYIICEMVMNGSSPGKRVMGLRVIRDDGLPLGFAQSLLRNLVRAVDFLPWGYGVGLVCVFASARSQRLGDIAAGTLVTRDAALPEAPDRQTASLLATDAPGLLTPAERALVRQFVERIPILLPHARLQLAHAIATPLRARLGAADPVPHAFAAPATDADEVSPEQAWLVALDDFVDARPVSGGSQS
jgi:uncharacterized RDD family membrane protein YckC